MFKSLLIQVYWRSSWPSLVCRCGFAFTSISDTNLINWARRRTFHELTWKAANFHVTRQVWFVTWEVRLLHPGTLWTSFLMSWYIISFSRLSNMSIILFISRCGARTRWHLYRLKILGVEQGQITPTFIEIVKTVKVLTIKWASFLLMKCTVRLVTASIHWWRV